MLYRLLFLMSKFVKNAELKREYFRRKMGKIRVNP